MANPDVGKGFSAQAPICPPRSYFVDSSNSTAFFAGDVVDLEADGRVAPAAAGAIGLAGATDDRLAASTAGSVLVHSDPDQLFSAQDDGGGTVSVDNVGNMADHVAGAGANGKSNHELGFGTLDDNAAAGFFILQAIRNPEFDEDSATEPNADNQRWLCMINQHIFKSDVADTVA